MDKFEKLEDEVRATEAGLFSSLFGDLPGAEVLFLVAGDARLRTLRMVRLGLGYAGDRILSKDGS